MMKPRAVPITEDYPNLKQKSHLRHGPQVALSGADEDRTPDLDSAIETHRPNSLFFVIFVPSKPPILPLLCPKGGQEGGQNYDLDIDRGTENGISCFRCGRLFLGC